MDTTIKTLISYRALKEFNYNDFIHVEVLPDVGRDEIKKAYIESKGRVIIKYLDESDEDKYYKKLNREIMNLKDIDLNNNVIRFYGVTKEPSKNYYSIVLQQCDGENLKEYLKNNFKNLDWNRKIKIAKDISNGLNYIHKANIVHRALCPEKILDHDGTFMIMGFSPSVSLDHPSDPVEEIFGSGDNIYVDPVCFNADYKYDKSSDIYSLGLILWKISSGKIPHKRNKETPVNLTPIDYKEVYENAWCDDSNKRPSIEEVVRNLENIDIEHVYQDSDYIPNVFLGRNNAALKHEACLFIIKGLYQTPYLFLTQNETFIGRSVSNHIVIKDQELGKEHAKIKCFQGKVEIFDLGSKSGIYVNDKKLEFRASRTLEKDDLIKLGKAVFQYLPAGEYENRIDKLLPIYNTDYLRKSLENEFKNARENKQNLSLLFFDLDHFGKINKQYSHEAGDYVLKELSELIQNKHVRPKDIFARYGGEEFTVLLNNTNLVSACEIAEQIRDSVETHPFNLSKGKLSITLSIGVSENSLVRTPTDLLNNAENACRKAKESGRNRVIIWDNEHATDNLIWDLEQNSALESNIKNAADNLIIAISSLRSCYFEYSSSSIEIAKVRCSVTSKVKVYSTKVLPLSISVIQKIQQFFENFSVLGFDEFKDYIEDLAEEAQKNVQMCVYTEELHTCLLADLMNSRDVACIVLSKLKLDAKALEDIMKELKGKRKAAAEEEKFLAELAVACIEGPLVTCAQKFARAISIATRFFRALTDLILLSENHLNYPKKVHYLKVRTKGSVVVNSCNIFIRNITCCMAELDSIPDNYDRNYVKEWLSEKRLYGDNFNNKSFADWGLEIFQTNKMMLKLLKLN